MLADFGKIRNALCAIKPSKNEKEFEHFKLMADLRMHYLDFKVVVEELNSENFKKSQTPALVDKLDEIFKDAKKLNKRFTKLNKGFLYDSELENQNELRIQPVKVLYNRLVKIK